MSLQESSSCFIGGTISLENLLLILWEIFSFIFLHPSFFDEVLICGQENDELW